MKNFFSLLLISAFFVVACSKKSGSGNNGDPDQGAGETPIPFAQLPSVQTSLSVGATQDYVNVMGNTMPTIPSFASVTKKAGIIRGYVKNIWGNPLENAFIRISSTLVGSGYTTAAASTDSKGYYEITAPFGAVNIKAASYVFSYGGIQAVQGLYPADGELSLVAPEGTVENFVFVPYGNADPAKIAQEPSNAKGYFGGAIRFNYSIYEDQWSRITSLPQNSEVEITLTPLELLDAREKRTFIIKKKIGNSTAGNLNFNANNIPVGKYKIDAKLVGGENLRMRAHDFYPIANLGLIPTVTVGTGTVLFLPSSSDREAGVAYLGGWRDASIDLELNR